MPKREVLQFVIAAFFLYGGITLAAEPTGLRKIRSAITSISSSMSPTWAAHESGIDNVKSVVDEIAERNPKARD